MRQDTGKKKSVEVGEQRKLLARHREKLQPEKAATRRIHDLTSGSHAQFSNHNERQTKTCEGGDRGVEAQKPGEMKRFHTEKWISTLVPAPKRSTLGVVAALDSVVGLCAGIESNISKNKDTQLYVHSDSKSCAFTKMSQEERCGKAESNIFIIEPVRCRVSDQCDAK